MDDSIAYKPFAGSFFVYSRVAEPFNSIFINNRLNTNSLVEPITAKIELQSQPPFLLYRNQRSAISGFWFYCKDDCVRVHSLLETLIKKCNNARPVEKHNVNHPPGIPQQQPQQLQQQPFVKSHNGSGEIKRDVDIFSMLSKAQQDYNNSGGSVEKPGPGPQQLNNFAGRQIKSQSQPQHQPLMKQLSNVMPLDITSPNVVNFFAAAQQPNGAVPVMGDSQMLQSQNKQFISNHPIAQPVQTLDEIEKQHRVSSSPPEASKVGFNNLRHSMAQQQQQSISPQPMIKLQQPSGFQQSNRPTLITPAMFQTTNVVEQKIAAHAPPQTFIHSGPLTQNQLMQALRYLMETDPEFIRKLHEAYVKVSTNSPRS